MIIDNNVESIILKLQTKNQYSEQSRLALANKFRDRVQHGHKKYGVTTERKDLVFRDWLNHVIEELMDSLVYLQVIMNNENMYYVCVNYGVGIHNIFSSTLESLLQLTALKENYNKVHE